ncbi:hypothetical protein [Streptomyces goshikiensis]|uniref:hypothetical protein n=1 Tax=Streptomyces goshikiensis TaxID=1942 RepID=UPI00368D58AA
MGLGAYDGKLYCAVRGQADDQGLYWSAYDGTTWRSFTRIPGAWSADGPALAHYWSSPDLRFNGFYLLYRGTGSV